MGNEVISALIGAVATFLVGLGAYFFKNYLPARQKGYDDDAVHTRKSADNLQAFTEKSSDNAFEQVVLNETKLIDHVLRNNDGRGDKLWEAMERLEKAIREGDAVHKDGLDQVIANSNKLLTIMSQEQSDRRGIGGAYVDPIMDAFQKSPAVKAVDEVVAAATETAHPVEPTAGDGQQVIAIVKAEPGKGEK